MNRDASRPPAMAIWLLRYLGPLENREDLTGDLHEHFAAGKAAGWFWRQVLLAILACFSRELRAVWPYLCVSIAATAALDSWGGRIVGYTIERAWSSGIILKGPLSLVFQAIFISLLIQPVLAIPAFMTKTFRWTAVMRALLLSSLLLGMQLLPFELWARASWRHLLAMYYITQMLALLIAARLGYPPRKQV